MLKYIYVLFFALLFCCGSNEESNIEVSDCRKITIAVEDCMNLHRGALKYIKDCGSLKLETVESYDSCDEILDYFGVSLISNSKDNNEKK